MAAEVPVSGPGPAAAVAACGSGNAALGVNNWFLLSHHLVALRFESPLRSPRANTGSRVVTQQRRLGMGASAGSSLPSRAFRDTRLCVKVNFQRSKCHRAESNNPFEERGSKIDVRFVDLHEGKPAPTKDHSLVFIRFVNFLHRCQKDAVNKDCCFLTGPEIRAALAFDKMEHSAST